MLEYTRKEWTDIIHNAIRDEMQDAAYYREMANMAPDYEARDLLAGMSRDEARHAEQLSEVYKAMTGRKPSCVEPHPVVSGYKEALQRRFHAETGDYKKYKEYYLCSDKMKLRDIFFDIMHDEARHAMNLLYLMHQYCCAKMHQHEHEHQYPGEGCKPGYGSNPDYGSKPGYGYGPDYHGPDYGHGPGYDHGPDYGHGPGHDHGPDYGHGPGHDYGPDYGHGPGHDHGPDYGGGPGYDDKPGYKEPAFGKLESKNSAEGSARDNYKPPAYKYPGYK